MKMKMKMKSALTVVLLPLFTIGVFVDGEETVNLFVTEGDSVTLKSGLTRVQTDEKIKWMVNQSQVAVISKDDDGISEWVTVEGSFKDRLQLDSQTGDLKISNIRNTDSGKYKVKVSSPRGSPEIEFTINVVSDDEVSSVLEGYSVRLRTGLIAIQSDMIRWRFGQKDSPVVDIFSTSDVPDERFRDRLKLDNQTGSLTITDTRTTDSGRYEVDISRSRYTVHKTFIVTVIEVKGLNGTVNKKWSNADVNRQTGDITIRNIQTQQGGNYKVEIKTTNMNSHRKYHIDIDYVRSVLEGDDVPLQTGLTGTEKIEHILWKFGDDDELIADLNGTVNKKWSNADVNRQTGDITIRNIQRHQHGDYKVEIKTTNMNSHRKYHINIVVPGSSLSPAAVAGFVGVGFVVGLLVAAAVVIYYRRKISQLQSHSEENGQNPTQQVTYDPATERLNT